MTLLATTCDTEVSVLGLPRPVDHTAHHRDLDRQMPIIAKWLSDQNASATQIEFDHSDSDLIVRVSSGTTLRKDAGSLPPQCQTIGDHALECRMPAGKASAPKSL